MDGMSYLRKTFTLPASSGASTSQRRWDYATMQKDAFVVKYGSYTVEPNEAGSDTPALVCGE